MAFLGVFNYIWVIEYDTQYSFKNCVLMYAYNLWLNYFSILQYKFLKRGVIRPLDDLVATGIVTDDF